MLAEQQMEAAAVLAALLAGVCEETGLTCGQLEEILGTAVASAVRDVTHVWQLSELMQDAPAEDSEQLEHRCQIVLAGCDNWRGVVLSSCRRRHSSTHRPSSHRRGGRRRRPRGGASRGGVSTWPTRPPPRARRSRARSHGRHCRCLCRSCSQRHSGTVVCAERGRVFASPGPGGAP